MSEPENLVPTPPTSAVPSIMGKRNEQILRDPNGPASDAALREYCDKYYHQLLPIIAEKIHQEKVQQENLKEVKARLNFEGCSGKNSKIQEVSQHSESRTLDARDLRRKLRSRRSRSMSGSPKQNPSVFSRIRRDRSESPRHRPEGRRDGGIFNRLGEDELSQSWVCEETDPFTPRIRNFELPKKSRMPNNVKTYDGSDDPKDHLKNFQAEAKVERWAMPTWCHMFNSTLTGSARVWFDDLPPESIDSYDDLKKAFLANYLQQDKCIKDSVEIHHIKQREGESTKDFVQRFKAESRHVKGALELKKGEISGKDKHLIILMVQPWKRVARQRITQSFSPDPKILFPPLEEEDGTEGPMIIEAEIEGHFIHRIYVDGGSASEILYEHCFNRLRPKVKNQMVPATAPLIGFSGEVIWPMGQISLPVKIGDAENSTSTWMNFVVVRSPSSYNGIIGRPGIRKIQAVPSTAHGMLKFPVPGGILTMRSNKIIPLECMMVSGSEAQTSNAVQAT
ncbi:reverse transcriptase domain-containing protein [Tanacetum coccineum]